MISYGYGSTYGGQGLQTPYAAAQMPSQQFQNPQQVSDMRARLKALGMDDSVIDQALGAKQDWQSTKMDLKSGILNSSDPSGQTASDEALSSNGGGKMKVGAAIGAL